MSGSADPARRPREVEIAHYWLGENDIRMLETVLEAFGADHPDVGVTHQPYSNHGLAIKGRMLREEPPPLFVDWPDQNLVPYHDAGALRDLTPLWEENGWEAAFIEGPRERAELGETYVALPLNIHRLNNLFYHVEFVEERGVDLAGVSDPRELLEVLEGLGDEVSLHQPLREPDQLLMLWSNVVIGQFGPEVFDGITRGRTEDYETEIEGSVRIFDSYVDLASDDAAFLDYDRASERFVDGESPFFYQGDWAAGQYLATEGFEYGTDWDRVNFPGSDGVYVMGMDAVMAARGAAFTDEVRALLEFLASPAALEVINREKGSIPPRRDVPMDEFPALLRDQFADFESARHFPAGNSIQVTPEKYIDAQTAFVDLVDHRDVDAAARAVLEAFRDS